MYTQYRPSSPHESSISAVLYDTAKPPKITSFVNVRITLMLHSNWISVIQVPSVWGPVGRAEDPYGQQATGKCCSVQWSPRPLPYTRQTPRSLFDPQSDSIPRNRPVDTPVAKTISACYSITSHTALVTLYSLLYFLLYPLLFLSSTLPFNWSLEPTLWNLDSVFSPSFSLVSCSCSFTLFMNQAKFHSPHPKECSCSKQCAFDASVGDSWFWW